MKNLVLLLAVAAIALTLTGCKKKHHEEAAMDGLNGVATENVVSVSENTSAQPTEAAGTQGNAIPVVVDNAPTPGEGVASTTVSQTVSDKPTPQQIQQALKNAGVYNGKVDGSIGPKTKKAVEAFQTQNGLKADGKVGPRTWKALSAYLNKPGEVSNPSADSQTVGQ